MVSDFVDFNLWMFFANGIFGFGLCYLRPRFAWWIVPIIVLISVAYLWNLQEYHPDVGIALGPSAINVASSISFAIALPLIGAFLGRPSKKDSPANNANDRE